MESQIAHGVGPSDAPWPILVAFLIFVMMLVPFFIRWPDSNSVPQQHVNRDRLMQQLMEQQQQGRPRTFVRQ